jgi:hypothetical protein
MSIKSLGRPESSPVLIETFPGIGAGTIANILDDLELGGVMLNLRPVATEVLFIDAALTVKEVTGVQHACRRKSSVWVRSLTGWRFKM